MTLLCLLRAENCIVVAEGVLQPSGVFKVAALGLPPAEAKADSIKALQVGHKALGGGGRGVECGTVHSSLAGARCRETGAQPRTGAQILGPAALHIVLEDCKPLTPSFTATASYLVCSHRALTSLGGSPPTSGRCWTGRWRTRRTARCSSRTSGWTGPRCWRSSTPSWRVSEAAYLASVLLRLLAGERVSRMLYRFVGG